MSETSFRGSVERQIEAAIEELANALANGTAADFADYKLRAGKIAGLRTALDIMTTTARRMNDAAAHQEERR